MDNHKTDFNKMKKDKHYVHFPSLISFRNARNLFLVSSWSRSRYLQQKSNHHFLKFNPSCILLTSLTKCKFRFLECVYLNVFNDMFPTCSVIMWAARGAFDNDFNGSAYVWMQNRTQSLLGSLRMVWYSTRTLIPSGKSNKKKGS